MGDGDGDIAPSREDKDDGLAPANRKIKDQDDEEESNADDEVDAGAQLVTAPRDRWMEVEAAEEWWWWWQEGSSACF